MADGRWSKPAWCFPPLIALLASAAVAWINTASAEPPPAIRFVHYNIRNWLDMERRVGGETQDQAPKPEAEKAAVVDMLRAAQPDVLGVCEIGIEKDVDDFQGRLKAAGIELPHRCLVSGADPLRHLALFSRFPVVSDQSVAQITYRIGNQTLPIQRGILDVTLQITPDYQLRLLGTHLKSRREVPDGEQAVMRRHEALLLREHAEKILAEAPETNLLVYGDLNDTRNEQPIKLIQGRFGEKGYLRDLALADADGHRFTYYWSVADTYDRIDFAFVNGSLWPEIDMKKSFVGHSPEWLKASDHRPLVITVLPVDEDARKRQAPRSRDLRGASVPSGRTRD